MARKKIKRHGQMIANDHNVIAYCGVYWLGTNEEFTHSQRKVNCSKCRIKILRSLLKRSTQYRKQAIVCDDLHESLSKRYETTEGM